MSLYLRVYEKLEEWWSVDFFPLFFLKAMATFMLLYLLITNEDIKHFMYVYTHSVVKMRSRKFFRRSHGAWTSLKAAAANCG